MLRRVVVIVALVATLVGCTPSSGSSSETEAPLADTDKVKLIQVGDLSRSYVVNAPTDVSSPMPLLVMFHGAGGYAAKAEAATGFTDDAIAQKFVVAYPNGTQANSIEGELAWNAGGCCGLARSGNVDDVAFILAMITELEATYPIDPDRIYLAGFSNGGMMSYRLACEHGDLFAGIAVVSGALNYSDCEPPTPLPVLIIHGTADQTVPYDGGETNEKTASRFGQWNNSSVEYATEFWRQHDGCETDAVITSIDTITTASYSSCAAGTKLEVVTIAGGTHTWPRLDTLGVDGSELILTFFGLN